MKKYKLQLEFLDDIINNAETMSKKFIWRKTVHDDTLKISIIVEHMEYHYDLDNFCLDV